MRKRILGFMLAAGLMVACGGGMPLMAATVSGTLQYTYASGPQPDSNNNWPACSTSITTECVTGFKVYDITNSSSPLVIGSLLNANNPTGTQTLSFQFTVNNYAYGQHTLVATTVAVNATGGAIESAYSAATIATYAAPSAPGAPAALTVTIK